MKIFTVRHTAKQFYLCLSHAS